MYSDKYQYFAMRLHYALPDVSTATAWEELAGGWSVILGEGVLNSFYVSEVDNPAPKVKSDSVDIPGANGSVYMTESTGRVTFEDKTVKVVLGGQGETANWHLFDDFKNGFQGRLCDFTFDDYRNVEWFQTGRVSIDFDEKLCTFTLTFTEVPPFRFSTDLFQKIICKRTNYEKHNNANAWVFDENIYGTPPYKSDIPGSFAYSFNSYGREYVRKKGVGAAVGSKMLFGVLTVIGGKVWFEDNDGNESTTYATTCTTAISGSSSELRMHFTVDGSYYEWQTVNGNRVFLPTVRCTYVLSNYVPIDSNGEIVNLQGDGIVTQTFPTNVLIRPEAAGADGIIICDGHAVEVDLSGKEKTVPRIVLPGVNAPTDGTNSKSVFCWVRSDSDDIGQSDGCGFRFIPVEVF